MASRLLRRRGFGALWLARTVSFLGDGVTRTALVLLTARQGVTAVAVVLLASTLPRFLGPVAGALADRIDRRRLMRGCDAGQVLVLGIIAATLPPLGVLAALVAVSALLATAFAPASASCVPDLVDPAELTRGNALLGTAINVQNRGRSRPRRPVSRPWQRPAGLRRRRGHVRCVGVAARSAAGPTAGRCADGRDVDLHACRPSVRPPGPGGARAGGGSDGVRGVRGHRQRRAGVPGGGPTRWVGNGLRTRAGVLRHRDAGSLVRAGQDPPNSPDRPGARRGRGCDGCRQCDHGPRTGGRGRRRRTVRRWPRERHREHRHEHARAAPGGPHRSSAGCSAS